MDSATIKSVFEEVAKLAPIGTALIASVAAWIAIRSLNAQRQIAQRRAATDLFIKTETDRDLLEAHKNFIFGAEALKWMTDQMEQFSNTSHYDSLVRYLTIHELIAVGIAKGAFDDEVCYSFWCKTLTEACHACEAVIKHVRNSSGDESKFWYLSRLDNRWRKKMEKSKRRGFPF